MKDAVATADRFVQEKRAGRDFWDANPCGGRWETYGAFVEWTRQTEPYVFDVLAAHDWSNRRVLEVGCGQGAVLTDLQRRGAQAVGIDLSMTSLRRAAEGLREFSVARPIQLLESDGERLPFADGSFDAVVSIGVLHHTPETPRAVQEIWRVLRSGGLAVIMLYRTGNPKWLATRIVRGVGGTLARVQTGHGALAAWLRRRHTMDDDRGTALLELFGVPTLKAYSNRDAREMFRAFTDVCITNYQPGFRRLADIVPGLRRLEPILAWIDRRSQRAWGFYQVIEARRP